jgi:hypothetical protein
MTMLNFCSNIYGQQTYGIKLNGGISNISITTTNGQNLKQTMYPQPSYNGGIYYSYSVSNKFKLGIELLFNRINGKQYTGIPLTDNNNNPTGLYSSDTIWRHISYLGIPIYLSYNYKRLNLNFGIQTNLRIAGNAREIGSVPSNGDILRWDNKFTNLSGIDKIDFGIRGGVIFDVYKNLGIDGNYYFGLNNNYKGSITSNWKMKNRQFTIGIRYKLLTINRKKKEK